MDTFPTTTGKIDLNKSLLVEVGGECGKYNTLAIEKLITIAQNLQKLIDELVKVDLESDILIETKNFKIDLSGYYKNSAIPEFVFSPVFEQTLGNEVQKQRAIVSNKFNDLMAISDSGDYGKLKDKYKVPSQRTPIVDALYNFTHSCGNSPLSIVYESNGAFVETYKIQRFKKEVRDRLSTKIVDDKKKKEEEIVAGLIKITQLGGKERKTAFQSFKSKQVNLAYSPTRISYNDKVYNLNCPLQCSFERVEDFYVIKNVVLDIMGTGDNEEDAENNFAEEFDFIYQRYNQLRDEDTTERIIAIRGFLNYFVQSIEVNGRS
jgi:hypothetical protein